MEGEEGQRIRITPNLPPRFFCDCDNCDFECQIRFHVEIPEHRSDLRCPGDRSHVAQVMMKNIFSTSQTIGSVSCFRRLWYDGTEAM